MGTKLFQYTDRLAAWEPSVAEQKKLVRWFYACWVGVNLLQATFTALISDEAYYWFSASKWAWGYFYHPPLTTVFIKAGWAIVESELGVRLFFVLGTVLAVYMLERLVHRKELVLFYAIVASMIFIQVTGMFAAPDFVLLPLGVAFYLVFRRFLVDESLWVTFLLAVISALMLYAKYHGILLIAFSFLFNLRFLITRRKTWIWIVASLVFFTPHLWWQYVNGLPSFAFHLLNRPGAGFLDLRNLVDYLPGQLLIMGPFVSVLLFWAAFRARVEDRFERTLRYNLLATLIFFFFISCYHHIEANWTFIAITPLVVLAHKEMAKDFKIKRWVFRLLPLSILAAIIFRLLLFYPNLLQNSRVYAEIGGYKQWAQQVKNAANGLPVVFSERYQPTAQYAFYSNGSPTYTLNPSQMSDFDFFEIGDQLQGKKVLIASGDRLTLEMDSLQTARGTFYMRVQENFRYYKMLRFDIQLNGNQDSMFICLPAHRRASITFTENPDLPSFVGYLVYKNGELHEINQYAIPADSFVLTETHKIALPKWGSGRYSIQAILTTGWFPPTKNSKAVEFIIE